MSGQARKYRLAVGYFDDPAQAEPVFDPGTDVDCPVCVLPLDYPAKAIRTVSLMPAKASPRSCFYRAHTGCLESLDDRERGFLDAAAMEAGGCPLTTSGGPDA